MSDFLPTVEFVVRANLSESNGSMGRAIKKVQRWPNITPESEGPTVHKYIERKMAKTIIMKLLGRSIGFNVLLKKITSLWCPRSPIQLMDLENGYYLIKFNNEDDYNKVVFGGPWVIFGQYLIVHLWSADFSTSQSKVDTQLV
ncbi:hypothetical protein J1N35_008103 [Gossypium stocksii]|uniref:DUF4283 domain-containing protein n=1 Tax=Gossypium stocksii TaxID=47602 RepID=A0A9D3W9P4_9ROSI|nr:hypothetical protein J1N35_008103 [Gossypium stocksii]